MATNMTASSYEAMQKIADLQTDILIIKRALKRNGDHSYGFSAKVKLYEDKFSFNGAKEDEIHKKIIVAMMKDGFGSPRDAFRDIYLEILETRAGMIKEDKAVSVNAGTNDKEVIEAVMTDRQFKEVDPNRPSFESRLKTVKEAPDYQQNLAKYGHEGTLVAALVGDGAKSSPHQAQAVADKRMEGILKDLALQAMDKVVDAMVAFDSKVDAVALKGKSTWNAISHALSSKKTKIAALTATVIVAAGLAGSPAQAADVAQADIPVTKAEVMKSMHEGRVEQMEHEIQQELKEGRHQGRADHMEQQYKNKHAMDKFSSNLQELKAEAMENSSNGMDDDISLSEVRYQEALQHPPALDKIMQDTVVKAEMLKHDDIREAVRKTGPFETELTKLMHSPERLAVTLEDKGFQKVILENPRVQSNLLELVGMSPDSDFDAGMKERFFDIPGAKEAFLNDDMTTWAAFRDNAVKDYLIDIPEMHETAFSRSISRQQILDVPDSQYVLSLPEISEHIMKTMDIEKALDLPVVNEKSTSAPEKKDKPDNYGFTSAIG